MKAKLLVICGPTATGKTRVAAAIARQWKGELISADSRQVYKGMDIATGKDVKAAGDVPLWMIDVAYPNEPFSVSRYVQEARSVISGIFSRGNRPIVVGGTGFYIKALLHPFDTIDIPPSGKLREELRDLNAGELGVKLQTLSVKAWEDMNDSDRRNPRRLIRKIEILSSGTKMKTSFSSPDWDVLLIGLTAPSAYLFRRIDERVDKRMEEGVLAEIQGLLDAGYVWDLPSMSSLGYRQWYGYFTGDPRSRDSLVSSVVSQWKYDEHKYARRQMTWFRRMPGIEWFDITDPSYEARVARRISAWYT